MELGGYEMKFKESIFFTLKGFNTEHSEHSETSFYLLLYMNIPKHSVVEKEGEQISQ